MSKTDIQKTVEESRIFEMNAKLAAQEAFMDALSLYAEQKKETRFQLKRGMKACFELDGEPFVIWRIDFDWSTDLDMIKLADTETSYMLDEIDFDMNELTLKILDALD